MRFDEASGIKNVDYWRFIMIGISVETSFD